MQTISIIIPTLNEEKNLDSTLRSVIRASLLSGGKRIPIEIIVVDGGSSDNTPQIGRNYADLYLETHAGRSHQLNMGANHASGDLLLFLHADTLLSGTCLMEIIKVMQNPSICGGGFLKNWVWSPQMKLSLFMQLSNWFWRGLGKWLVFMFRVYPGDNGIFVRKSVFDLLGGFREMWICEDFEFSYRLRSFASEQKHFFFPPPGPKNLNRHIACIRSPVITSTRRFEEYGFYRVWRWWIGVFIRWRFGWSQEKLKKKYLGYDSMPKKKKRVKMIF